MTSNKPDLSDLIKRNQQLEEENARLRQELAEERGKHEHTGANVAPIILKWEAPITEAPKPKPETQSNICSACDGTGEDDGLDCQACGGVGLVFVEELPKLFSVHRIDTDGYRPDAVHFGIDAMPSMLAVLRHIESKQWWIIRNSDSVMIAQSKDS